MKKKKKGCETQDYPPDEVTNIDPYWSFGLGQGQNKEKPFDPMKYKRRMLTKSSRLSL